MGDRAGVVEFVEGPSRDDESDPEVGAVVQQMQ